MRAISTQSQTLVAIVAKDPEGSRIAIPLNPRIDIFIKTNLPSVFRPIIVDMIQTENLYIINITSRARTFDLTPYCIMRKHIGS